MDDLPYVRDKRVKLAMECFKEGKQYFSQAWTLQEIDLRFVNGDSDNNYQWPQPILQNRQLRKKPILTVNMTAVHNFNIKNDIQQNRPGMKFLATGGGASMAAAKAISAIGRRIEYQSNAPAIYDAAVNSQIDIGQGYWRVITKFVDDESNDQDIYLAPVWDPLQVIRDPNTKEPDHSDMRWCIIFDDMPKERFAAEYGEALAKKLANRSTLNDSGWITEDHIRIAEFYYTEETEDELIEWDSPKGKVLIRRSALSPEARSDLNRLKESRKRKIITKQIKWIKIAGDEVLDETDWPGKYIPLIPLCGVESFVDGVYDTRGHTRAMKDPQRIYNIWTSAAVEYGGIQSKVPYIAAAEAIEGYEGYWNTANEENFSVLPFKAIGDDGKQLPPPSRQQAPMASEAYIRGMEIARQELMNVSGQQESMLGIQGNERTGAAKQASINQGDRSTAHFKTKLSHAMTFSGKIILDLIPKIYDTQRTIAVIAEDGTTFDLKIDPDAKKVYEELAGRNQEAASMVLNPAMGQYWVQASTGPGYATQRQQMQDALTLVITQNPQMSAILTDLWLRTMDFDGAAEAAERAKRMIPPQALGKGPTQQEQALMQELTQVKQLLQTTLDDNATKHLQLKSKEVKGDVTAYQAETARLKVFMDSFVAKAKLASDNVAKGQDVQIAWAQLMADIAANPLGEDTAALSAIGDQGQSRPAAGPPIPGARQGPDSKWYFEHSPGQFAEVMHPEAPADAG